MLAQQEKSTYEEDAEATDWSAVVWDRAACRSEPPEWFDAETEENAARALAVCAGCPVRRECFAAAAADRAASGVWGGVDLSALGRAAVAS